MTERRRFPRRGSPRPLARSRHGQAQLSATQRGTYLAAYPLTFFGEELLTVGHPTMRSRRRVKSKPLPLGSSLYGAIQLIGQSLRARYQSPEELPSDMVRLLTQLNESTEPELPLPSKPS